VTLRLVTRIKLAFVIYFFCSYIVKLSIYFIYLFIYLFICLDTGLPHSSSMTSLVNKTEVIILLQSGHDIHSPE